MIKKQSPEGEKPFIAAAPSAESIGREVEGENEDERGMAYILAEMRRQERIIRETIPPLTRILGEEKMQELNRLLDQLVQGSEERGEGHNPEDLENLQQWVDPVLSELPEARTLLGILINTHGIDIDNITRPIGFVA